MLQAADFVHHRIAACAYALDFALDLAGLDEVVCDIDPAGSHQHRAPDGNAPGNSESVNGEGHGFAARPPEGETLPPRG